MNKFKTKSAKRTLSALLTFIMLVSILPSTVFAVSDSNSHTFTICVKDSNGIAINEANVNYTIKNGDSVVVESGDSQTDENGYAVITEMKEYSDAITNVDGSTISISYSISKDGYQTIKKNDVIVSEVNGNINESIDEIIDDNTPDTFNVSVSKIGSDKDKDTGTVKINSMDSSGITAVTKDSTISLEIKPIDIDGGRSYIKSLTIGTENISVEKFETYNDTLEITEDTEIVVEFATEFTVEASTTTGGIIELNGNKVDTLSVDKGNPVKISVTPDSGYQISKVIIDGVDEKIDDTSEFSKNIDINKNISISATFIKVYTIKLTYNEEGTVVIDPSCEGGQVAFEEGKEIRITAKPNLNYRVSKVIKKIENTTDYEELTYEENDKNYEDVINSLDKDYSYEITFAPNNYKVTSTETSNGKIEIENNLVDYDQNTKITFIPENNSYRIGEIKIKTTSNPEGVVLEKVVDEYIEQSDGSAVFTLKNITEDIVIKADFEAIPVVYGDWKDKISITTLIDGTLMNSYTDKDGNEVYVYSEDVSIKSKDLYNRVNIKLAEEDNYRGWKEEFKISSTCIIEALQVKTEKQENEEIINLNNKKIVISIDRTVPEVILTPKGANSNNYYNKDVEVEIDARDPGYYSGIKAIEYSVENNGIETQRDTINVDGKETYNGSITVDSTKNNSDDVKVTVIVTDVFGNEKEQIIDLKINITKPTISVSIDGILHPEAMEGYYNEDRDRTATITIVDRSSTFDETAVLNGLSIIAKDKEDNNINISKSSMLSKWTTIEGKTPDKTTHTATITFSKDANYEWDISYTNKADLTNDSAIAIGESIYKFTIDKKKPSASIEINGKFWYKLISTLTFGFWRNYSVSAEATGIDEISPLYDIKYYKSNLERALSEEELISLYNENKFINEKYKVDKDEQFVVYARVTDYAGNTVYISTDGAIVDTTKSNITLTPEENLNEYGIYNKDVNVSISVKDNIIDKTAYSGIKNVKYTVESDGKETQSGILYEFTETAVNQSKLTDEWSGNIIVDSSKNNDENVKVTVISEDNAGNSSTEFLELHINIDKPIVNISFNDSANKVIEDNGYFGANRVATIKIIDRASAFSEKDATNGIIINAKNAKGDPVDTNEIISQWSHDENTHTATITFEGDGNYTWSFNYTNKADNYMEEPIKASGTTPFRFTVDKTNPTGTITVDTSTWDDLLKMLTFGLYSKESVNVKATSEDLTSPTVIEYYKTSNPIAMTKEELDKESFIPYEKEFEVKANEQFVVYLKIIDYAGNYIYINSNGYIVDDVKSDILIIPDKPNSNNTYNEDVNVSINITDAEPYSGIKMVDYWVVKDNDTANPTQQGNLYTFNKANPTQAELLKEWDGSITVDAKENNSSNVTVYVKTVDNAGNENTKSIPLDIDVTAPEIGVIYDNNKDNNGNTYFNDNRIATISITERSNHFDANAATEGIIITAVDSKGKDVKIDTSKMISEWTTKEGTTADEATHTATIKYLEDANYTFAISYTDKADNVNKPVKTGDSIAPYKFTVDKNAPTGTIKSVSEEGRETTWNELVDSLTFGFWSGKKISLTGTSDDVTSPIDSVEYYKTDATEALKESEIKSIKDWKVFNGFSVVPNEQFTVYLKITDKSGNTTYISTDGMIADNTSPREEAIAPEITATPEQPINGLYNGDVKVSIKVDDPLVSGTYSGLKTVKYRVLNMGEETQSGTLYSFVKDKPSHNDLLKTWTGDIIVDSTKNNSNDVVIEVYAEDNSLNSSKDKVSIKVDITAPVIDIKYNNNNADSQKYYKEDRIATVIVTERNFNAEDVKIAITNTDGTIPTISDWKQSVGSGNQDSTTHTATINYKADGDYTFKIEYTDLADNKCAGENYEAGTTNPKEFTVDKTLPQISISYNNNGAQNGKYFNANRTATVVVKEHNFDVNRVEFTQTASKNGASIAVPSASWSSNGDIHTATISYNADGDYTFDVKMKDMPGNDSTDANYGNSIAAKDFTIDTDISEPEITGVENGKAYKDDVIPVINFSDINYSDYKVQLTRTSMSDKNVDVTKEFIKTLNVNGQGGSGTNDTFKKEQENDGIYTLYVKANDKAGNESEKTVTFTVNRFGSVYEYSDYLMSLIENDGAYTKALEKDLVITEYNADKLIGDSLVVEITHDGKPIEDIKYTASPEINNQVEVGSSGWFQYQYTISKENFAKDGVYKMSIASKDATGNSPENTNYKDKSILFRVDSTAPELTSVVGLEEKIINAQELTVKYTVFDTIGLKSIKVYVDGKQQGDEITDFSTDVNNYSGSFVISESNSEQDVRIVIEDMAGNITDTSSDDFTSAYVFEKAITVSTNTFVRLYANKLLFWGSIGGSLVLAVGIWYAIYGKKKKEVEENE